MTMKMGDVFLHCEEDAEMLTADSIRQAVVDYLDDIGTGTPESVRIYAFARMGRVSVDPDRDVLEVVIERLDENFGSPDDGYDTTDRMKEAAKVFATVIEQEYIPWRCDRVPENDVVVPISWKDGKPEIGEPGEPTVAAGDSD